MLQKKPALRRALAVAAFGLAALLLAFAVGEALSPKNEGMAAFYAEPKNSVDVLFVGSSHSMAAFNPTQIWAEQGFTSYNLYSWSQPMWASYYYIKEALAYQSPGVVVLEGFSLCYGNTYIAPADMDEVSDEFSLQMRPGPNRAGLAWAMSQSQTLRRPVYRYQPLLRYHTRWKGLNAEELAWPFTDHYATGKGFGPVFGHEAFSPGPPPAAPAHAEIYPPALEYFMRILRLSREEGFSLVVSLAPYVVEYESEWSVYGQLAEICAAEGVPLVDYISAPPAGFSYENDMAEHAHVNQYGAEKVSRAMGAWLADNYDLPDRRSDPAYAYWNEAAEIENWDLAKMRLRLSPDAAAYMPRLKDERLVALLVTRGDLSAPGHEAILAGFESLGLDTGVFAPGGGEMLAVLEGGAPAHAETGQSPRFETQIDGHEVALQSGPNAAIRLDGEDLALNYDGALVAVYDRVSGEVIQSVAFRPEENGITRTD